MTPDPPMPPPHDPNARAQNEEASEPQDAVTAETLPPMFDRNLLINYKREQVAWWDETRPKCDLRSSDCGNLKTDYVYRVRRQDSGKIDTKDGTFINCTPTLTKVKYSKEIRLALGVAIVKKKDGSLEGRRCEPFDYTDKMIVSEADWQKKVAEEIKRVRTMNKSSAAVKRHWFETNRGEEIYENDPLTVLKGVGKATAKKLEDAGVKK